MARLKPQGMVLTLYGDYIRPRDGEVWVGSLIQILKNFGLSEQAIRSALSRMCRKGLLKAHHIGKKSYFSLSPQGDVLLAKGTRRIFERRDTQWDGTWHIVAYSIPEARREARDHFRQELSWMGFGPLSNATWVSPWDLSEEVKELAQSLGMAQCVQIFKAQHLGLASSEELVSRCWDLRRIHRRYVDFVEKYSPRLREYKARLLEGDALTPAQCFVERFMLIHEYRRIPYFDPDLPTELLPRGWLRSLASSLFLEYHSLLAPRANQYFDSIRLLAPKEDEPVKARSLSHPVGFRKEAHG